MSKRSRRLRKVRPCYSCGHRARHFKDNGGAESKADPCSCRACLAMPAEWRTELRDQWQRALKDRQWGADFDHSFHAKYPQYAAKPIRPMPDTITLDAYAWPGGYQMMYYIDGDPVCPKCVMEVLRETYLTGREEILRDVFYEGPPETCSHCNEEVESAYGDPDASEEDDEGGDDDDGEPKESEQLYLSGGTPVFQTRN